MKKSYILSIIQKELEHYSLQPELVVECSQQILEALEGTEIIRPIKNISNSETIVINKFGQVIGRTEDSNVIEIGWEEE